MIIFSLTALTAHAQHFDFMGRQEAFFTVSFLLFSWALFKPWASHLARSSSCSFCSFFHVIPLWLFLSAAGYYKIHQNPALRNVVVKKGCILALVDVLGVF